MYLFVVVVYTLCRWTSQNLTRTSLSLRRKDHIPSKEIREIELINYDSDMFFFGYPFFFNDFLKCVKSRFWLGCLYSVDWTTGLDYWTGLLDWTTGLDYWTGLLDYWTGLLDWTTGLDYWTDLRTNL